MTIPRKGVYIYILLFYVISFPVTSLPDIVHQCMRGIEIDRSGDVISTSSVAGVYALLGNGDIMTVNPVTGHINKIISLKGQSSEFLGRQMAFSSNNKAIFVLFSGGLYFFDVSNNVVRSLASEQSESMNFNCLYTGQDIRKVYLFGTDLKRVLVNSYSRENGKTLGFWEYNMPEGLHWFIYQGLVSPDENRVWLSYHGKNTTGIDYFDINDGKLVRCHFYTKPNFGCLRAHGGFVLYKKGILAATGGSEILRYDEKFSLISRYETNLANTHLMEFIIDNNGILYAVGSCLYRPGFSRVNINTGEVLKNVISTSDVSASSPCGEKLVLYQDKLLAGGNFSPNQSTSRQGRLVVISKDSGEVLREVLLPALIVDFLIVPESK